MRMHKRRTRRYWTVLQRVGIGMLVAAIVALGLVAAAGATVNSGDIVPNAAQATGTFTAGTPFASGQNINVVIPANTAFASPDNSTDKQIVECSAPNGVVPTLTTACDGETVEGPTVVANTDGSFTLTNYTVYALPDLASLGEGSGGPTCGATAATECILYIGDNYENFTAPHLWSDPFFIEQNNASPDSGTPAGDGTAPAGSSVPDATNSTAAASPVTVPADGVNTSTVTVTLLDTNSVPVSGKAVTLTPVCTPGPCSTQVTGPTPATTDGNGQTTFTVTDTAAQSVTLTAADPGDSVTLSHTASVTFVAPTTSATNSTVSANPTNPPADGSTTTTITVTLRDQGTIAQPIAGDTVTLTQGSGHASVLPTSPNTTNAQGVATFTASDATVESVTFTATDTTTSTVLSSTVTVTFGTLSVSAAQSTVAAPTPAPLGAVGTTAVVTLRSSTGSPVSGKAVSLQASSATAVIGAPSSATTGSNGQVSFSVTDSVAEPVTLTATDTTDGITVTQEPTVTFGAPSPSATASNVIASPTTIPADGETQSLITVTVNDQFGKAVSEKTVTVQGSPAGNVQVHPIAVGGTGTAGVTNSNGVAEFEADDTHAEAVTFTATDTTDNVVLSQTASVTYTPGPADPAASGTTVTASPANPPADGSTPSTVTVTLTDFFSNPIAGKTIALKALNGSSSLTPATAVTDQNGQAAFTVTDATAEVVTYQATDTTDSSAVLDAEAVVTFGNPPVPPPDAADCSVVANPTSVAADGTHTATVTVLLYDGNGGAVTGKAVTLAGSSGTSNVTAINATTDDTGMATFAVSDTTAESVKYTATDTTDNIPLTTIPVTVTYTAAAAGSTTTSTTTTSPSGATTTTIATNTAASGASLAGSAVSGTTGNTGAESTSPSLATTGASPILPWLVGLGTVLLVVGTIGRRRASRGKVLVIGNDEA